MVSGNPGHLTTLQMVVNSADHPWSTSRANGWSTSLIRGWSTSLQTGGQLQVQSDNRYGLRATVITSQLKHERWHDCLAGPTGADAICDRVLHGARKITL